MSTVYVQERKGKHGKSYAVRYADPLTGKKVHYQTFKMKREAQRAVNELRTTLDSGKAIEKKPYKFSPRTFNELADLLEDQWNQKLIGGKISAGTIYDYHLWLNIWRKNFGDRFVNQIKTDEIIVIRDNIAKSTSALNANKYLKILKRAMKLGCKLKTIISDPSETIPTLNEKCHVRDRFLFPDEIGGLLGATQKTRAKFYLPAIICLGVEHGASKQEILDLAWSHIDFDYNGHGLIQFYRTKNGCKRTQLLMPRTKDALLQWKKHLESARRRRGISVIKSNNVFCRIDGQPLRGFNKAWWHALKVAGIEDFHFHDLRHTYCSNLVLSGSDLKTVRELIGHSDISMTDRYSHLTFAFKEDSKSRLAEHYRKGKKY